MDAETLNNRKTTRQIFAYKPGNGLLMQSRFYNTSGGVYGAAEDSRLYRDLVQREISELECVPNLWKTYPYIGRGKESCVHVGHGFGGYADWKYEQFDGKISIRADHENDYESLTVGTWGICICCADETNHGVYCSSCDGSDDCECCEDCGEYYNPDDIFYVRDRRRQERRVCCNCRDDNYAYCNLCGEYYPNDCTTYVEDIDADYCDDCLREYCEECEECGYVYLRENMHAAIDRYGNKVWVCDGCLDDYECCDKCGTYVHSDCADECFDEDGTAVLVCPDCRMNSFSLCEDCGRYFKDEAMVNGRCPECCNKDEV